MFVYFKLVYNMDVDDDLDIDEEIDLDWILDFVV